MVSQMKCIKNDKWALHNIGLTSLDYNHYPSWWYSNLLTPNLRFPHELIHYVSFEKFGWICTLVCYKLGQIWLAKPSLLWILSFSSCDRPVCCFISASCVCASNTIEVKYNICTLCHIIVYCLSITSDLYAMWVKSIKEHITGKSMMFLSMSSTHAQLKNQHQQPRP